MASEIILRAALSWAKSGTSGGRDSRDIVVSMAGTKGLETRQTVGTSEEALLLGEVPAASAHFWIRNLDATNTVTLKPATGGAATVSIGPGRVVCGQFASTVSAPFVQASVAPCDIEIVLVQA